MRVGSGAHVLSANFLCTISYEVYPRGTAAPTCSRDGVGRDDELDGANMTDSCSSEYTEMGE